MKTLEILLDELDAIQNDRYFNLEAVNVRIIVNTLEASGKIARDGSRKHTNIDNAEFRKQNPYCVEILARTTNIYACKHSKKKGQMRPILASFGSTLHEALDRALGKYRVYKGDYSNREYAQEVYEQSVKRGYEGDFDEWLKDIKEYNEDRINGTHIIEKPIWEEDIKVKEGVYKQYPKGINKQQDKRDKWGSEHRSFEQLDKI